MNAPKVNLICPTRDDCFQKFLKTQKERKGRVYTPQSISVHIRTQGETWASELSPTTLQRHAAGAPLTTVFWNEAALQPD